MSATSEYDNLQLIEAISVVEVPYSVVADDASVVWMVLNRWASMVTEEPEEHHPR